MSDAVRKLHLTGSDSLQVEGQNDLLVYRARCCNPIRGEEIIGYVTRGKGVAVHARSCPNVQNLLYESDRRIPGRVVPRRRRVQPAGAPAALPRQDHRLLRRPHRHVEGTHCRHLRRQHQHPLRSTFATTTTAKPLSSSWSRPKTCTTSIAWSSASAASRRARRAADPKDLSLPPQPVMTLDLKRVNRTFYRPPEFPLHLPQCPVPKQPLDCAELLRFHRPSVPCCLSM